MKRFLLILVLIFSFCLIGKHSYSALEDFWSRSWWVTQSGLSTGTINDIQYSYLGGLGYTGTLNNRLKAWLSDETCVAETEGLQALVIEYFEKGTTCP